MLFGKPGHGTVTVFCLVSCLFMIGCSKTDVSAGDISVSESTDPPAETQDDPASRHLYHPNGVHNNVGYSPLSSGVNERGPDEPTPYNEAESAHLGGSIQEYSIRIDPQGADILFGYAFDKEATPDSPDATAEPYRHPQSFYFSGAPIDPPNAPIVSQNYTNFRMEQPDSSTTWDQVAQMCPAEPQWCCLFSSDCPTASDPQTQTKDWATAAMKQ